MITVNLEITGLEKATSQVDELAEKMKDMSKPLKEAGDYLMEFFMMDVYGTQGSALGKKWAPLTPKYAAEKFKKWGWRPILVASGKMSESYSLKVASDYLLISNDAKNDRGDYYAAYHQEGTSKMVARPIMKFPRKQLQGVTDIIVNHINSLTKSL